MAIQQRAGARDREAAVLNALIVILAATVLAVVLTWFGSIAPAPQAVGDTTVEKALIEIRAGERALTPTVPVDQVLIDVRAGERASAVPLDVVLSTIRAEEKLPLFSASEIERSLIQIRAGEREGR